MEWQIRSFATTKHSFETTNWKELLLIVFLISSEKAVKCPDVYS